MFSAIVGTLSAETEQNWVDHIVDEVEQSRDEKTNIFAQSRESLVRL